MQTLSAQSLNAPYFRALSHVLDSGLGTRSIELTGEELAALLAPVAVGWDSGGEGPDDEGIKHGSAPIADFLRKAQA